MRASAILVAGWASGPIVSLDQPLSFWGGVDPHTGEVIDVRHPQHGLSLTGAIVTMPHERGSSSASSVLAELIRAGVGPAGIITAQPAPILALGSLVAAELYPDRVCPVVAVAGGFEDVVAARQATILVDGTIELSS